MRNTAPLPLPDRIQQLIDQNCKVLPLNWIADDGRCSCRSAECEDAGKHPILNGWPTMATADAAAIARWQRLWPRCNWGWMQDRQYVTLDLDRKKGKDGITVLHTIEAAHEPLPRTICASTPTGGAHLTLLVPDDSPRLRPANNWWPGIDIRSGNSYIVIEPSITEKGAYRFWRFDEPALCPEWLLEMLPLAEDGDGGGGEGKDEDKEPEADKFELAVDAEAPTAADKLIASDYRFHSLWERSAEPPGDGSQSTWDFALAIHFASIETCTDQDIADLICAYRRTRGGGWGHRRSAKRQMDYLRRTVKSIRKALAEKVAATTATSAQVVSAAPAKPLSPWPQAPAKEVYHGLAGGIVSMVAPYVESDPVAVLAQFLVAFGIAVGIRPHFMVGATRHTPTTYAALVGATSRARKGTSWEPIETLFKAADPGFSARITSGLGSGERLVSMVADAGEGFVDRRLLIQEPELGRLLTVVNREGSTLSAYLRAAYDGKPLRNEVKEKRSIATLHHIGLIGHCTEEELQEQLREEQVRNGLANRIVWFCVKRVKRLADPPVFEGTHIDEMAQELAQVLRRASPLHRIERSREATKLWTDWYADLGDDDRGVVGAIMARIEANVTRFALIYALMDASETIEVPHLQAAIALVEHSTRCVSHIWGRETGDVIADKILEELAFGPLNRSQIAREVFGSNLPAYQLEKAGRTLERKGLIVRERVTSAQPGRPAERWRAK